MSSRYDMYCPVSHALSLVGDRWALLVVTELLRGPKRYTDLVDSLSGIGTNILASRLRDLETHGIVSRRQLPPPAASRVYELTDYGLALKPVIRELAMWGARSLGAPHDVDLFPGWLENILDMALAAVAPAGRFEFRVGDEVASIVDSEVRPGSIEQPDVLVEGDPVAVYHLFVDHQFDLVKITGSRRLLDELLSVAPAPVALPTPA